MFYCQKVVLGFWMNQRAKTPFLQNGSGPNEPCGYRQACIELRKTPNRNTKDRLSSCRQACFATRKMPNGKTECKIRSAEYGTTSIKHWFSTHCKNTLRIAYLRQIFASWKTNVQISIQFVTNFGIKKRERNRGDEVPSQPLVANPPSVFPQMPEQNGHNFRNKMVTNAGTKQPQLPEQNGLKCRKSIIF